MNGPHSKCGIFVRVSEVRILPLPPNFGIWILGAYYDILPALFNFIKKIMKGFINFIREQGIVGLAVGFILGGAVSKVVAALVSDIINPLLGAALGTTKELKTASFDIGAVRILYGDFISVIIDFLVIALVIYYGVRMIGLDKLDKKIIK